MRQPGEKLTLDAFLSHAAPKIDDDAHAQVAELHDIADHLLAHLSEQPELAAQISKLRATIPADLADADTARRQTQTAEANRIASDIKRRWIEADNAPLVEEIDDHLERIAAALEHLRRPAAERLREAAAEIDRQARVGTALEGIERQFLPWAVLSGVLFLIGLVLFLAPGVVTGLPMLSSFWTILICLGALPLLCVIYARRVLPRTVADQKIEALNLRHFVPLDGLYFPEGETSAGVVLIPPPPTKTEGTQAREEREQHRRKARGGW